VRRRGAWCASFRRVRCASGLSARRRETMRHRREALLMPRPRGSRFTGAFGAWVGCLAQVRSSFDPQAPQSVEEAASPPRVPLSFTSPAAGPLSGVPLVARVPGCLASCLRAARPHGGGPPQAGAGSHAARDAALGVDGPRAGPALERARAPRFSGSNGPWAGEGGGYGSGCPLGSDGAGHRLRTSSPMSSATMHRHRAPYAPRFGSHGSRPSTRGRAR
jgi:hypothetical protein